MNESQAIDIRDYLQQHRSKSLMRLLICGSVDDGKSTLLGRLLFDSHQLYEDQLQGLHHDVKGTNAEGDLELAMLVDGLQAEREQGITIDVAYRFFSTDKRKFIIADTPGHEQYTRNMVTGASTAEAAILLVDARYGVQRQTRRHAFICHALGIRNWIVAINKMDLVNYDEQVFDAIQRDLKTIAQTLGGVSSYSIPVSALKGENTLEKSDKMPWYQGEALLPYLENLSVEALSEPAPNRFCVQWVNRPNADFRGYSGTVQSGCLQLGQAVKIYPGEQRSYIKRLVTFDGDLDVAEAGQAVTVVLQDERDISRGDWIIPETEEVGFSNRFDAHLVWFDEQAMQEGQSFYIKFAARQTEACVSKVDHKIDINRYEREPASGLQMNEIGLVSIELAESTLLDCYRKGIGAFILIDRFSNATVAAGMIREIQQEKQQRFSDFELELNALMRKHFPHWHIRDLPRSAGESDD